jgi:hypothetical protein
MGGGGEIGVPDVRLARDTRQVDADLLVRELNAQREHILGILVGLDEQRLRRPVLPSGWSCAGLVRHLTLDVEQFWFRAVMGADREAIDSLPHGDEAWRLKPYASARAVLDGYRREVERANELIAATPLAAAAAWWPEGIFGEWQPKSLEQIILHVITETATHAGHLDAVRELIDGKQWIVLTE